MKLFLIAFAVVAAVSADVSHLSLNEYLPPVQEAAPVAPLPTKDYLPPAQQSFNAPAPIAAPAPGHVLADDGYRYKTQRRVVYRRHRRDVSHLPSNEYLPPVQQEAISAVFPSNEYLPPQQQVLFPAAPAPEAPSHVLADDGYRYKTQRRVVYRRHRRDVSHLPDNEYLPPGQQETIPVEVAPIQEVSNAVVEEPAPAHELADDGYHYKTQRRVVYRRNRRDVSHLPNYEYLPPAQEATPILDAPVQQIPVIQSSAPAQPIPVIQSSAPAQPIPVIQNSAPAQPIPVVQDAAPAHELADDGYHYKTQRRVVYRRNRRDVSHLLSNDYLPPVQQELLPNSAPSNEYLAPVQHDEPATAHVLSDDGYRYKTQRRVVYRRH